jgi:hypothetical protein
VGKFYLFPFDLKLVGILIQRRTHCAIGIRKIVLS